MLPQRGRALDDDAQRLGQHLREDGADGRSEQHPDAAGDGGEHHVERQAEPGDRVGTDVHLVLSEDRAAQRAHGRRQRRDLEPLPGDVDANGGRGVLVLAGGVERIAVHAGIDPQPHVEPQHPQREGDVEGQRPVRLELQRIERDAVAGARRLRAERAARKVAQADDAQPHELGQRQRQQREVVAGDAEAEAGIADQQRRR